MVATLHSFALLGDLFRGLDEFLRRRSSSASNAEASLNVFRCLLYLLSAGLMDRLSPNLVRIRLVVFVIGILVVVVVVVVAHDGASGVHETALRSRKYHPCLHQSGATLIDVRHVFEHVRRQLSFRRKRRRCLKKRPGPFAPLDSLANRSWNTFHISRNDELRSNV